MLNPFSNAAMDAGDRRAAIEHAEAERAQLRRSKIEAQGSPMTTPAARIRLWEDFHGLQLPRNAGHKLIDVIARDTALTVLDVQEEQLRRGRALQAPAKSNP